jgi:CRISPR system Cascade subunit CasA
LRQGVDIVSGWFANECCFEASGVARRSVLAPLNLLTSPWLPALRRDGAVIEIRPCDITDRFEDNPIVDIVWPRADLRVGALEFLIGLLSTICPPEGGSDWLRWHESPPSPEELARRFAPFEKAFDLDGPGPRFMQEFGGLEGELTPVAALLIDQPGANAVKNNTDLFVKRGRVAALGRSTAAAALYALQTFAPAGGAGHRTGLRGGGPLTTLAFSQQQDSLWRFLWLNAAMTFNSLEVGTPEQRLEDVFPWLAATRLSDKSGRATTLADIHPAQCFWAMPRRIMLEFEENAEGLPCAITGVVEDVIVQQYRTRPYGVNYQNCDHPLSPYYRVEEGAEWLAVHPPPGGLAYRHWIGFVCEGKARRPAACIAAAKSRLRVTGGDASLRLYGYDMDNMKARGFVEAERPLLIARAEHDQTFRYLVEALAESAREVAGQTVGAIRAARGGESGEGLDIVREGFFAETEHAFFATVRAGLSEIEKSPDASRAEFFQRWLTETLAPCARKTFDREVSPVALADSGEPKELKKAIDARRMLHIALSGQGKGGAAIYGALGLGAPGKARKGKAK